MSSDFTVGRLLSEEAARLPLALLAGGRGVGNRITTPEMKRPGLALAGFLKGVVPGSVYIGGRNECEYIESLGGEAAGAVERFLLAGAAAVVLTDGQRPPRALAEAAEKTGVPLLATTAPEAEAIHFIDLVLERRLAPSTTVHAVLLDVFGMGVLLTGSSGVGKSETALELIVRGHRLVADDVVRVRRVHGGVLVGSGSEMIRYHMEVRGLGVIDIRRLFGAAAVLEEQEIDLAVHLETWQEGKEYDRLGLDESTTEILGVRVPYALVPVQTGRNLAVIIEAGAIHHRLKAMGEDTARDFNERLTRWIEGRAEVAVAPPARGRRRRIARPRRRRIAR